MNRYFASAAAAAFVVVATGVEAGEAEAQEFPDRVASQFDLGFYAGGSISSRWYDANAAFDEQAYKIGYAPIIGGQGTLWFTPTIGARLHLGYAPSRPPSQSDGFFDVFFFGDEFDDTGWPVNNWLYDLSLAFRPFITNPDVGDALASTYFFVGGGGYTANLAGDQDGRTEGCAAGMMQHGVCYPIEGNLAHVGQGTVGAGIGLVPLAGPVGLFGEVALHGYSSPVHTGPGWTDTPGFPAEGEDRFTVNTRIAAGINFAFGDLMPAPPPEPPADPTPPAPPPPAEREIEVCVIEANQLQNVDALFLPETNDTVVVVAGEQVPFSEAYPTDDTYAAGQDWFVQDDEIEFMDQTYVKFGLTRIIGVDELERIGDYEGVNVYSDSDPSMDMDMDMDDDDDAPDVIYIPTQPGCEFQPYQPDVIEVRG